jgi:flagellin
MASILVNPSALTALQALRATQAALATTQKEVSTGLKISSAADNASTWAIAETMKSDKKVLSTIAD